MRDRNANPFHWFRRRVVSIGTDFPLIRGFVLLDRKYLRENQELVTRAVALKNESVDIGAYYAKDTERRAALQEMETLQAEANKANKAISEKKKARSCIWMPLFLKNC